MRITQSGAAPSELETQVTKKVEDAVAGVNGVKHITSTITEGSSVTTIEFRLEINQDRALNDVKDAIARIRAELPRTIDEPIVTRVEIEGLPIMTYAARGARHDARGAVLVRRRHRRARAPGREGRRRRSSASAASTARSASRSIPTGCWRSASPRAT